MKEFRFSVRVRKLTCRLARASVVWKVRLPNGVEMRKDFPFGAKRLIFVVEVVNLTLKECSFFEVGVKVSGTTAEDVRKAEDER